VGRRHGAGEDLDGITLRGLDEGDVGAVAIAGRASSTPNVASIQLAASRSTGSASPSRSTAAGTQSKCSPFAATINALRSSPRRRGRHNGVLRKRARNSASSRRSKDDNDTSSNASDPSKAGSPASEALISNGQHVWHRSQPNNHCPMAGRSARGIGPRCSIVR